MVTLRFFAAARAAMGTAESTAQPGVLGELLDSFGEPVLGRCSFLVNGVAAERSAVLADGDLVDVLPPFAGG